MSADRTLLRTQAAQHRAGLWRDRLRGAYPIQATADLWALDETLRDAELGDALAADNANAINHSAELTHQVDGLRLQRRASDRSAA